jgi:hypothetical protein
VLSLEAVDDFRFTQEQPDRIVLQVMLWKELDPDDLSALRAGILAYLREPIDLEIQVVDEIREEKRKFRRFVSLLGDDDFRLE